jgi:thiamine-monophosphate kinase
VLRSGARPGDVVAVSGPVHLAARGLALLFERAIDETGTPDAARAAALRAEFPAEVEAQLAPAPPLSDGPAAALAGATAMLDVSDGLAIDARRIATASGVLIDLDSAALGVGEHPEVLDGGEAHALLATFPPEVAARGLPGGFRVIGRVAPGEGVSVDGAAYTARGGWDPYADADAGGAGVVGGGVAGAR